MKHKKHTSIILDAKDKSVLKDILMHPRDSIADVARRIGVQRDTVTYRMNRFEKSGLIEKYHVIVNPEVLGHPYFVLVLIAITPSHSDISKKFVDELRKHPHITQISRLIGSYDYMLQIAAPDVHSFDSILDDVKSIQKGLITKFEVFPLIEGIKTDDFVGLVEHCL